MKGLEVSEVRFSELKTIIDYRIESEYFVKKFLYIDNILSKVQTLSFTSIANFENGRPYCSDCFNCEHNGIPVSKIGDVTNKRPIENWEYITENEFLIQKGKLLSDGDILMTLTGDPPDVGKVNYVYNPEKSTWNQRVARIKVKTNQTIYISNYVLFVVLSSEIMRTQLERYAKGIRQRNLGNESLEKLQIPILPHFFQLQIEQMVKSAHAKLEEAKQLYAAAEDQLLSELGLKDWQPKNENINVKTLNESFLSSGRLDAEYYQSKYDEIEREIASYYDALEIGNLCFVNQKNTKPKDGVQYKYIELSNINIIGEITGCTIDYGENLPTRARQVVKSGDVIVSSIEGSLDSCALVTPEYDNAFCSTGFYIIRSKIITSETLLVLMKLKPIQQLLKKGCSGTILTAINYDNFCNIIIPVPDGKIQTEISSKIQRCFALKAESKCLLEEAKKMVENEIEKVGK